MSVPPQTRPMFDGVDKTLLQLLQVNHDLDTMLTQVRNERDQYKAACEQMATDLQALRQPAPENDPSALPAPANKRALRSVQAEEGAG